MCRLCCSLWYWLVSSVTRSIILNPSALPGAALAASVSLCQRFPPSFFPLSPSPPCPKEPAFTQTPFFFRSLWRRSCFDSIVHFPFCESMGALPKKVIYGQKETLNLTLIRSLHYSAGFQEDRSPRQLDWNMNHTMLQQLSHIHPVTEIHLFIISCNTVGDKVHC